MVVGDRCVLGGVPLPGDVRMLTDFCYERVRDDVEFEARVGRITHKDGTRIGGMGILTPAFIDTKNADTRFDAKVTKEEFTATNLSLNHLHDKSEGRISVVSTTERDYFFNVNGQRLRATVDQSGEIVQTLEKKKLGQLMLHLPDEPVDIRIAASRETVMPGAVPTGAKPEMLREKERLSFQLAMYSFDLTIVHKWPKDRLDASGQPNAEPETTYEIELEVRNPDVCVNEKAKLDMGDESNTFQDICTDFLHNIKSLPALIQSNVYFAK